MGTRVQRVPGEDMSKADTLRALADENVEVAEDLRAVAAELDKTEKKKVLTATRCYRWTSDHDPIYWGLAKFVGNVSTEGLRYDGISKPYPSSLETVKLGSKWVEFPMSDWNKEVQKMQDQRWTSNRFRHVPSWGQMVEEWRKDRGKLQYRMIKPKGKGSWSKAWGSFHTGSEITEGKAREIVRGWKCGSCGRGYDVTV